MQHRSRFIQACAAAIMLGTIALPTAWAWGPTGHTLITQHAIQMLTKEMKPFYEANTGYVVAFTMLPDNWRETHKKEIFPQHFCDLDALDTPPFAKVRVDRATAEARFGKDDLLKAGVLPWTIEERYHKLVSAFKANDAEEIVLESALLAHFVGDAHVPFHATKSWDGNKPEEKGLHYRWETALLATFLKPESINPQSFSSVKDPLNAAFDWCVASYGYIDTICKADDRARERDPGHTYTYYKMMWDDTGDIVEQRLTSASEDLAGMLIAAWQEAGKPELGDKAAPMYWGR